MSTDFLSSGTICTPEQYASSIIHCLTRNESIGLLIIAEAGILSFIAVCFVFLTIVRNLFWQLKHIPGAKWRIIHGPLDLLMFSLFFADALQAIGAVMDIKWIRDGKVDVGVYCTAQGVIQQLGETGVAMSTITITVYTFIAIWIGKGTLTSMIPVRIIVGCIWLFLTLMVLLGNVLRDKQKPFEAPTPYWCWISADYLQFRIWGEYIWFWITLLSSFFIYIPLYFWYRGNIVVSDGPWWNIRLQKTNVEMDPRLNAFRRRSLVMLAYPAVYCLSFLPVSVVRWIGFAQEANGSNRIPSAATFGVVAVNDLSGLLNVILFITTRPNSRLFTQQREHLSVQAPSTRSQNIAGGVYPNEEIAFNPISANNTIESGGIPSRL